MRTCGIFCAGEFDAPVESRSEYHCVIGADGGVAHLQKLGWEPDLILGDFDSLGYVPIGAKVFPVEKDDTDTMLAVRKGLELGCDRFVLYGCLDGPRLDHTVANFQTLQFLADRGAVGYLVGLSDIVTVVKDSRIAFPAGAEGILSVFCMGADARGVTLEGLRYPLEQGTLTAGFPLGVSNRFTGKPVAIRVESGSLLVIYSKKNGFPARPALP